MNVEMCKQQIAARFPKVTFSHYNGKLNVYYGLQMFIVSEPKHVEDCIRAFSDPWTALDSDAHWALRFGETTTVDKNSKGFYVSILRKDADGVRTMLADLIPDYRKEQDALKTIPFAQLLTDINPPKGIQYSCTLLCNGRQVVIAREGNQYHLLVRIGDTICNLAERLGLDGGHVSTTFDSFESAVQTGRTFPDQCVVEKQLHQH